MRKQVNFSESAGRTVEAVNYEDNRVLVTFTDGTFAVILAKMRWEYVECEDDEMQNPFKVFNPALLLTLGIVTHIDVQAEQERREEETRQQQERAALREREEYERLKMKFDA